MIISSMDSVAVSGVITSKKVPEEVRIIDSSQKKADVVVSPEEHLSVSETITENSVLAIPKEEIVEFGEVVHTEKEATVVQITEMIPSAEQLKKTKRKVDHAMESIQDRSLEICKVTKPVVRTEDIEQVLKDILVEDFGPGEQPLKELAAISILMKKGVTVDEVNILKLS